MHFRNNLIKLNMQTFYYSDKIILIIYVFNSKNLLRSSWVKYLLSLRASANAFAPSVPISLSSKIMAK